MFKVDTTSGIIYFGTETKIDSHTQMFKQNYKLNIYEVIVSDSTLFILGFPETTDTTSERFVPYSKDNIYAFDSQGNLIWNKGKYKQTLGTGIQVELPASSISLEDSLLKVYYQSDHEVWLNPKTGETIKEEFVFKK